MAVQENNLNLAEVLLAAGADPKERDLSVAAGNENLAIVKGLLKAGIDPVYLGTALDTASWKDNLAIVEVLLEADVDLNRWISYGISPLFPAARGAGAAVIKALLKAGADPGVRTSKTKVHGGATPLHVAAQFNHNPAAIEALVEAGIDPNAGDEHGHTPLQMAIRREVSANLAVIQTLLKVGADPNVQSRDGATPLHWAARSYRVHVIEALPAIIEALLEAGADPKIRDNMGKIP